MLVKLSRVVILIRGRCSDPTTTTVYHSVPLFRKDDAITSHKVASVRDGNCLPLLVNDPIYSIHNPTQAPKSGVLCNQTAMQSWPVSSVSRRAMSHFQRTSRPSDFSSGASASAPAAAPSDGVPFPDVASTSTLRCAPPWVVDRLSEYTLMNRTSSSGQCQISSEWTPVVLLTHNGT
jgi:hypothetical protein